MRVILTSLTVAGICLGGCATPPPASAPVARNVKVDMSNAADAQYAGYTLVNKNGEKLYCRKDVITGSLVQTKTVCLTKEELLQQAASNQNAMERLQAAPQTKMGQ